MPGCENGGQFFARAIQRKNREKRAEAGSDDGRIGRNLHEELLQEVLGKQVLQVLVNAFVLVRRTRLAHAENRQSEVLHLDARLHGRAFRVVAAY